MTDPVFALEPDVPRNVRLARWLLFRLLSGLREGSLTVREGAQTFHFGDPAAALRAEARVCTPEVYWRLLTGGSLAAAEAWMDGDWESHQLTALLLPMRNVAVPMLAGLAGGLNAAPLAAALYGVLMYVPALALVMARQARVRR